MLHIAVGDVHGNYTQLRKLLDALDLRYAIGKQAKLVFMGDLEDRGPDSERVISTVKSLCDRGDAVAIMGNHEDMMLKDVRSGRWENPDSSLWIYNGGGKTIQSYVIGEEALIPKWIDEFKNRGHYAWMEALPLFYETDTMFFSHAPVRDHYLVKSGLFRTDRDGLLWNAPYRIREGYPEDKYAVNIGKLQVVGHIHALRDRVLIPRIYPHIIYTDTGCGCAAWAPLSAVVLNEGVPICFHQALSSGETCVQEIPEQTNSQQEPMEMKAQLNK